MAMDFVTHREYEELRTSLKQRGPNLSPSVVIGSRINDFLKVAIYHFLQGARDFDGWSCKMQQDFGEAIVPHLQEIWLSMPAAAVRIADQMRTGILRQIEIAEVENMLSRFEVIKREAKGKFTLSARQDNQEKHEPLQTLRNTSALGQQKRQSNGEETTFAIPERKLSAQMFSDLVVLGAYYFEGGRRDFEGWSRAILTGIEKHALMIRPHLPEIWSAIPAEFRKRSANDPGMRQYFETMLGTTAGAQTTKHKSDPGPEFLYSRAGNLTGLAKVAGMHELKALLKREVVRAFRNPEVFRRYGLTVPQGILLYGPPGCGKTYIARLLAEELGCSFIEASQSDVGSSYIHGTALRIRTLFETAEKSAPCVLFVDEFEGTVPSRANLGSHQQFKSEEVNEFLVQLNGCSQKKILVIAATNEPQKIDAAVLRTGRMDKLIYVGPPDAEARFEMLHLHLSNRPTDSSMDIRGLALILEGYSASDIKFIVDEAARNALERATQISTEILMQALKRVPPSITEDIAERYRSFGSRGI